MLERPEWVNLNGPWEFALDPDAKWSQPEEVDWTATILVPFSPETPASGIGNTGFYRACWYRRTFEPPKLTRNQATDPPLRRRRPQRQGLGERAEMRLSMKAATHRSRADITNLRDRPTVRRRSSSAPTTIRPILSKPRGKQDWQLEPALHLVSANHRHLADRLDGARPGHIHRLRPIHAGGRALGDRL